MELNDAMGVISAINTKNKDEIAALHSLNSQLKVLNSDKWSKTRLSSLKTTTLTTTTKNYF
jgi:hypothetical protein